VNLEFIVTHTVRTQKYSLFKRSKLLLNQMAFGTEDVGGFSVKLGLLRSLFIFIIIFKNFDNNLGKEKLRSNFQNK